MAWVGPVIGAASAIAGDLFSQGGQEATNKANMAMMMQNEQWQEHMSDTAMQRRVTDMEKAGLNPIMAAGGPGASMGSVSQPNLQNPSQSFGQMGSQVTSALQLEQMQSQIDKTRADTRNVDKQTNDKMPAEILALQQGANLTNQQAVNAHQAFQNLVADQRNAQLTGDRIVQEISNTALDVETKRAMFHAIVESADNAAAASKFGIDTLPPEVLAKIGNALRTIIGPVSSGLGAAAKSGLIP